MSKISLGGIFGFVKNKFTPTLKKKERFPIFWRHKDSGILVEVTTVHKCVGPDFFGTMIRFVDREHFGAQEFSMEVKEFMSKHEKCRIQTGRS